MLYRQLVSRSELPVTFIMRRHSHDGAGTIIRQYIIGNPNRYGFLSGRVNGIAAGKHPGFFPIFIHTLDIAFLYGLLDVLLDRLGMLIGCYLLYQRMLRRQDQECGAEDRIRAGSEDADGLPLIALQWKVNLSTMAPSDPVFLHGLDMRRPVQIIYRIKQVVGVFRNPKKPLLQTLFD